MKPRRTDQPHNPDSGVWVWHLPGCGRLEMWDTREYDRPGRTFIGYRFYLPKARKPLFEGTEYGRAANRDAIDSLNVAVGLLAFLTLDEDSGSEVFESYSAAQLDWARNSPIREELAMFVYDHENPEES